MVQRFAGSRGILLFVDLISLIYIRFQVRPITGFRGSGYSASGSELLLSLMNSAAFQGCCAIFPNSGFRV